MAMELTNAAMGAVGTLVRALLGAWKSKDTFNWGQFGKNVVFAVLTGLTTGFVAPDPATATLGGYVGGEGLDKVVDALSSKKK